MAKKLIIGQQSALLIYRAAGAGIIALPEPYHAPVRPVECTTSIRSFRESGNVQSLLNSSVLDLVARSRNELHRIKGCHTHLLSGDLPDGSFWSVGGDVLVTSPALTLLMLSRTIARSSMGTLPPWCAGLVENLGALGKKVALAELASELCGIYSIAPNGRGELERHAPFISLASMRTYLMALTNRKSASLAHAALRAASPLSASPRETQLYLVMTSPWPFGYGLPLPNTNCPITLKGQSLDSDEDCRTVRFSDYFWKRKVLRNGRVRRPLVLEYDSDEFHTASAGLTDRQLADQAERRDRIESQGNGFIRITTEHTRNFSSFDDKMHQLSRLLRIDLPERSPDELEAARLFFASVFDSSRFRHVGIFQ